ncbi:supporter of activation of yellow protein [Drosophila bipectinata]|uniref:supporter of activation of yellow protein n=1 Tax=Drosophila bipectinata TaxID=42026 RepID=UPI001C8ADBC9|nr:supporter of activation of yellow protein [Drosophila bipectinata]XP_017109793.2 supporter of activation of yellow protein [Drosophila bipectinata]XP_017109794.2 supporter of activation of yellow protein [Drosophila bipectinata]XP_017109795.2 supporter of activation of yellow protein [Drosophila bipectinata]
MNDLRQQQMVAATSSSGSGTGTVTVTGTGIPASIESAPASSTAGATTTTEQRVTSNSNIKSGGATESTTNSSEEEQRVSSTSSPAQREQQLNADHEPDQDQGQDQEQEQEQHQQRQEALHRRRHHQPGHITSTTASPPPQPQPPSTHPHPLSLATSRDDAPGTTGVTASASAAPSASTTATEAASSAAGGGGPAMAATAIDVKGEERDGHKIILKLSKHVAAAPNSNLNESQPGGDERRVEPLRIQLSSDGGVAKPQDASDADASSCSSSCAEDEVASSLAQHPRSTPHIVPKLTIRAANEERVGSVVPKLTIKLPENPAASGSNSGSGAGSATAALPSKNDAHLSSLSPASASSSSASSSSSSSSSSSLAEMQTVPKLMIKTTLSGSSCITSSSEEHPHQQQIPKLTIKTGGGGGGGGGQEQQHMHTVIMKHDLSNAQSIPKLTIKTKSIDLTEDDASGKPLEQLQPLPKLTIKNLCSPKHKVRAVLEEKLPSAASKLATAAPTPAPALITNGMESNSSSQEFCGFSDLDADQAAAAAAAADEGRRNSDDMDIDESLSKEHDPQMFHRSDLPPSNGIAGSAASKASKAGKQPNPVQLPAAQHNVVEMVDLTSSPSPGSSPAHVTNNFSGRISPAQSRPANLIDCLRMKADGGVGASSSPNSTILLSQLTAPPKSFATASPKSNSSRYPQLTERLLANGGGGAGAAAAEAVATSEGDSIGAPIEILDTPEGSPHITYMEDEHLDSQVLNNHHPVNRKDQQPEDDLQEVDNNNENHLKRTSSAGNESPSSGVPPNKQRRMDNDENDQPMQNCHDPVKKSNVELSTPPHSHRSRKQKHERILNTEMEDPIFPSTQQPPVALPEQNGTVATYPEHDIGEAKAQDPMDLASSQLSQAPTPASTGKRRGRPKRVQNQSVIEPANLPNQYTPTDTPQEVKSRRVQLLRKRLAIDMVSQDQLPDAASVVGAGVGEPNAIAEDEPAGIVETPTRRDRQLRASRRTVTPSQQATPKATRKRQSKANAQASQLPPPPPPPMLVNFGGSDAESNNNNNSTSIFALAAQIDLTMCSSSSSTSSGAPGAHQTASGISGSGSSSMLPPTTILSSSDRLKDVIFQPNDFSSIMATQQLRSPRPSSTSGGSAGGSQADSHEEDNYNSALDNSGDESVSTMPVLSTPTPTRGRGRGRGSRGGSRGSNNGSSSSNRGGGSGGAGLSSTNSQPRAPRMSRGASAVAKAIAMSRPRCVGGLKHTPDPERLKGLFSPSPQVFEEDTRMSADLSNSMQSMSSLMEPPLTPQKQPDFLNNEESQSSMVSNASLLDSNQGQSVDTIISSSQKRPKKKKMEICVAEDTDYSASSIAEYDWPPPKGCCPSKNRDTFMIQEQVALYLGITSFKRKYPDLPRRAVDMEERNWLQEKGLVSEKMCDLGITAVWASDILDIMYADFYDKYEEYKEYIRLKHLREIEAKQKALGLTVGASRGLQARDRAMLSASKWNVYFNKTRKEERLACLDLQTFTMNQPQHRTAPLCTRLQRSISNYVRAAAEAENMEAPPTLVSPRVYDQAFRSSDYAYPLTVVPDQFSFAYRVFKPAELRAYPLDTALDLPSTDQEAELQQRISPESSGDEATVSKEPEVATAKTQAPVPVRRSRRALRQQSDKTRSASNGSTSSAASVSSASSGNASSSDTDSGDDSDCSSSSTSSCNSLGASSSAASDDEAGRASSQASRLLNCGVCLRSQHRNARDMPEAFIRCYSCRRRVHPSCIDMPQRMVGRVRNYNWQCAGCKCCIKCRSNQRPGKMLFCEQCDRGYHIYCLGLRTVPDGRWSCERCCVCMRCGATRPEGLSQVGAASPGGERGKNSPRGKRAKWVHEYRTDHVTKLREHSAMFCAPCAKTKAANAQAAALAAAESSLPASRDSSPAPLSVPDPSPSPTLNGGPDLSPGEAPSPKLAAVSSASPPVMLEVVPTSMSPLPSTVATISRRPQGTPVTISTMQCSSSLSRNGTEESTASTATTTTTISATTTAVAGAGAAATAPPSTAASGGASPATSTTPIGIAPPPVVA